MAVTSDTRTRMSAEQRREQLLDATKVAVGEQGFHGVSIDAVAKQAGVSRPIVYSHFGDLGGLLEAMLERESEGALRQLADVLPTRLESAGSDDALLAALRAYLEVVRADPVTWRLVLMPPEGAPQLLRDQITRGRDAVIDALAAAVAEGDTPRLGSPDPELTARMLSAVADESARLLLTHPRRFPIDRLIRHAGWMLDQQRND
jgi:AcrR family transcriptional regulator